MTSTYPELRVLVAMDNSPASGYAAAAAQKLFGDRAEYYVVVVGAIDDVVGRTGVYGPLAYGAPMTMPSTLVEPVVREPETAPIEAVANDLDAEVVHEIGYIPDRIRGGSAHPTVKNPLFSGDALDSGTHR